MKDAQDVIREISELTTMIRTKYPELYRFIDEDPITLPATNNPQMSKEIMENYLERLKFIMKQYLDSNKNKKT
ncbi:hypothetical protein FEZ18_01335 [Oceanihabitans sp. IOP_32]|uniref:hypothetical protein n=1 Tax=Oceanihabitans sp. IOP_32 TaxID=2529032 RepID=UPI001293176D|nr:hypothetical protein [Oceanihabitans sp. IOP_32]QFZ53544.1 hypothetical protein FEZ18_01335 [Oceanihabitans sp. IOP_32]